MTTNTMARPVPKASPRPVYLNELMNLDNHSGEASPVSVPTVAFVFLQTGFRHIWSYVGADSNGNVLFSGSGGGFYTKQLGSHWHYALEGIGEALRQLDSYEGALFYINNQKLSEVFKATTVGSSRITVIDARPTDLVIQAKELVSKEGNKYTSDIILTTDASIKGNFAGVGWLMAYTGKTLNVRGGAKSIDLPPRQSDSLTAELIAIQSGVKYAVASIPTLAYGWGSLTVKSDSMSAIRLINQILSGKNKLIGQSFHHMIAKSICHTLREVNAKFVWVRGHDGDEMNEYCDRLAVTARRNSEYGVEPAVAAQMVKTALGEAYVALRNRSIPSLVK